MPILEHHLLMMLLALVAAHPKQQCQQEQV
jgi:hypothetical protein